MAERVMKWDGFNLDIQNMTTSTVGYRDLAPSDVRGSMKVFSTGVPNRGFRSLTDQQKPARVVWSGIDTRGAGNQKNTGVFQARFWAYAGTGFKTIPTGYHYRFARAYDTDGEWIACLCYRGRDLVLRTGGPFFGAKVVTVWKNALSDSGWANKWHRIEISCNRDKSISAVRIDKRSWINSKWLYSYPAKIKLEGFSLGAVESDSPNNVAFRNLEIIDSCDSADFTYDWVPPVGPSFKLPASVQVQAEIETANISLTSTSVGTAPIKSAKWYSEATDGTKTLLKTETPEWTNIADYSLVRGPYTEEQTEKITLEVEDHYGFKVVKSTNVYVGAAANTGPDISVSDKNILLGEATTVNISTVSAGTNGAEYPAAMYVLDSHSSTSGPTEENTGTSIPFGGYIYPWSLNRSDSNPDNPPVTVNYRRTGTVPWNVCTFNFGQFTKAGTYTYEFTIKNSNQIESTVTFDIVVDGVDTPEFTVNSPALPDEQGNVPEYFLGSEFDIDIDIATGNAGVPSYVYANNNLDGTDIINGQITPNGDGTYKFTGTGVVTSIQEVNGFAVGIVDTLGNSSRSDMIYYNARQVIAPIITLTEDFLVNAQVTPMFTIEVFVTEGTIPIVEETAYWSILEAPTGYDGLIAFDTYKLTFEDYDTAGNYTFEYSINDTEGNTYSAQCHVYISFGSNTEPDAPRDILDWMSLEQLEHEATKALSGIELVGNTKQDIEWYRRAVLSLQIPNIDSMSYEQIEREYFKAVINGDLERNLSLYGELDGGSPDSLIEEEDKPVVDIDDKDPDEGEIPVPPKPPVEPPEPDVPAPVVINFDFVVNLKHSPRRVLQSFAWDQTRNVWYGAQVNPDSTQDTLIYKFDSTGEYLGTHNQKFAGHGSSIAYQRVGSTDYIYNFYEALGLDKAYRGPARVKYTNGGSVSPPNSAIEMLPSFYGTTNTTMNLYGDYITTKTKGGGIEAFRLYKLSDYLAAKNNPVRVISYDHKKANLSAYQGHAADEKYLYVHRGGNVFKADKPSTYWDKPYLMVYEWATKKVRTISTVDIGYDPASKYSEAEGVQRYDVGGVKYIYIGKITGKTGARIQRVYRFRRDEMEAWFAQNG